MARSLQWASWLAFPIIALPIPAYLLVHYFGTTAMLFGLLSLALGAIAGLVVTIFLLVYRHRWLKRLRERLAADGITADELEWFTSELTTNERKSLKAIEGQNLLLADAYRETLAARLTATRVVTSAKRELVSVERRLNRAANLLGTDTTSLQDELRADRTRLAHVRDEGTARRAEAEARLQMIEAAASRGANWTETNFALQRLGTTHEAMPLALEAARLEQQAREEVESDFQKEAMKDKR